MSVAAAAAGAAVDGSLCVPVVVVVTSTAGYTYYNLLGLQCIRKIVNSSER